MTRIRLALGLAVLVLLALWLATSPFAGLPVTVFAWRGPYLQGTGLLAMGLMSVAMILATRPVLFEPVLGGLDKMYRLHKWLGVTALVLAVSHWLWVEAPKWLVDLGWLARPVRMPAELPANLKFHRRRPRSPLSIKHLRWISGLVF
jgi:predicted ferric reductase